MTSLANISQLVGSSQYRAFADDELKDEDNAAWVMQLEPWVRDQWIQRISWIRRADRLAEQASMEASCSEFQEFRAGWQGLEATGQIAAEVPHGEILLGIRDCWFGGTQTALEQVAIAAWDDYLQALAIYHQPNLAIATLKEYETMLGRLAGRFFQIFPFLSESQQQTVTFLGIVDQFYNNLRDLHEDARQGICYFPDELLTRFGVSRTEILQMNCFGNPGYYQMIHFWLDDYLPQLRQRSNRFLSSQDLHPSFELLKEWSLYRYQRIERIFRQCQFNYARFPQYYWTAVKQDLAHWQSNLSSGSANQSDCSQKQTQGAPWAEFASPEWREGKPLAMKCPVLIRGSC